MHLKTVRNWKALKFRIKLQQWNGVFSGDAVALRV